MIWNEDISKLFFFVQRAAIIWPAPKNQVFYQLIWFFAVDFCVPETRLGGRVLPWRADASSAAGWRRTWRCLRAPSASEHGAHGHSLWVWVLITGPLAPHEPRRSRHDWKRCHFESAFKRRAFLHKGASLWRGAQDVSSPPSLLRWQSHGPLATG